MKHTISKRLAVPLAALMILMLTTPAVLAMTVNVSDTGLPYDDPDRYAYFVGDVSFTTQYGEESEIDLPMIEVTVRDRQSSVILSDDTFKIHLSGFPLAETITAESSLTLKTNSMLNFQLARIPENEQASGEEIWQAFQANIPPDTISTLPAWESSSFQGRPALARTITGDNVSSQAYIVYLNDVQLPGRIVILEMTAGAGLDFGAQAGTTQADEFTQKYKDQVPGLFQAQRGRLEDLVITIDKQYGIRDYGDGSGAGSAGAGKPGKPGRTDGQTSPVSWPVAVVIILGGLLGGILGAGAGASAGASTAGTGATRSGPESGSGPDYSPHPSQDPDDPKGTTIQLNPDGTRTKVRPDGIVSTKYSDGTIHTTLPDGTTVTQYPDGTQKDFYPDGTAVVETPDGQSVTSNPDGSTGTVLPDGTKIGVDPDGTRTVIHPDGRISITDPTGKTTDYDRNFRPVQVTKDQVILTPDYTGDGKISGVKIQGVSKAGDPVSGHFGPDGRGEITIQTKDGTTTGTFDESGDMTEGTVKSGSDTTTIRQDGSVQGTYKDKNGVETQVNIQNGQGVVTDSNGSHVTIDQNGQISGTIKDASGSSVSCTPDGRTQGTIVDENGQTTQVDITVKDNSVTGTVIDETGNKTDYDIKTAPDGTTTGTIRDDKESINFNPDGTVDYKNARGGTGKIERRPDGSVNWTETSPSGTQIKAVADKSGAVQIQNADGTKVTVNPDGSIQSVSPDGSVQHFSADQIRQIQERRQGRN